MCCCWRKRARRWLNCGKTPVARPPALPGIRRTHGSVPSRIQYVFGSGHALARCAAAGVWGEPEAGRGLSAGFARPGEPRPGSLKELKETALRLGLSLHGGDAGALPRTADGMDATFKRMREGIRHAVGIGSKLVRF